MSSANHTNQQFEDILKQNNCYVTKPRTIIFDLLHDNTSPLSLAEIFSLTKGQISRASVYRTLENLEKLNVIKRIAISFVDKYELSDRFRQHHHHLTCDNCGRVIPIKLGGKIESTIQNFGRKHGFQIKSHEVELRGLCSNCY